MAIAPAIVRTPKGFLFDEPLSHLDAKLRVKTRMELPEFQGRLDVTSIYLTHDQIEATTLADRIVIMNNGVVAQVASPREVHDTPADESVAGFIASPSTDFTDVRRRNRWMDLGRWAHCPAAASVRDRIAHPDPAGDTA